ncbi:MAG: hypothetical protein WCX74_01000 [Candidatus Paceibacterota bacterium]
MSKNIKKSLANTFFSLIIAALAILPNIASAAKTSISVPKVTQWSSMSVDVFLSELAGLIFTWAAPLCILMIIIGGIVYMTAGDNESQTKTGKGIVKFALIGLAIVLAAGMLMTFVANLGA